MISIWDIKLTQAKNGEYKVRISYHGGAHIVHGRGPSAHRAYRAAEAQLVIKPWLTSTED